MEGSVNNNLSTGGALSPSGSSSRTGSPPWTLIVAGDTSSPAVGEQKVLVTLENQPGSSDDGNAGGNKKPAWNKRPSNGSLESGAVLMGEELWPALSESTKASPKLSSSDSSKNLSDSVPVLSPNPQGTGTASSPSVAPMPSPSSTLLPAMQLQTPSQSSVTSPKPTTNANLNPNPSHGRPARQKSMKRDGGGNAMANGGFSHQPSSGESSYNHNSPVKPGSGGGFEGSSRDNQQNHPNREVGSRNAGGDHPVQRRNSFRRGNGEPHSRGDGSYQNYGGRRGDQDRGNQDWNHSKSFNGRDGTMQPRVSPRGFVRTPPVSAPFVPPVAMQPYMNPMGMPDVSLVYFPPSVPFGPALSAPMYFAAPDPQLKARITNQIDYYFSNENLIKDTYLRQNMDENGWVSVVLIAGFKKVKQLTENIQLILEAVQSSSVVEAQGDKIRKRGDWKRWIMPPSVKFQTAPGLQSPTSPNVATLCADIQSVVLDEKTTDVNAEASSRSSSGDLNSFSQATKGASSSGC